jgi:hypothetical protein
MGVMYKGGKVSHFFIDLLGSIRKSGGKDGGEGEEDKKEGRKQKKEKME